MDAFGPLLREPDANAAYVVGSWARGEADPWSDVDGVLSHSIVELADWFAASIPKLAKLPEQAGLLDQYYVAARYPNGLPFEALGERQAREAIESARAFVGVARRATSPPGTGGSRV
jgi:predicted nucleotidyltransferase